MQLLTEPPSTEEIWRFDAGPIEVVDDNILESPDGFLILNSYPSRSGVLEYREPNGNIRRELRHPDHVFNMDSLATLAGKPVTSYKHPPEMLNPKNVGKYQSGTFGNRVEVVGDGLIKVVINLTRQDGIDAVKRDGLRELSLGYRTDFMPEPGVWRGERYDGKQTNIRYNHGTILRNGRAGYRCGLPLPLRLDSADPAFVNPKCVQHFDMAIRRANTTDKTRRTDRKMVHIQSGLLPFAVDLDVDPSTASVIANALQTGEGYKTRFDSASTELEAERQKRLDTETELDIANGALFSYEDPDRSGRRSRYDMEEDNDFMAGKGGKGKKGKGKKGSDDDDEYMGKKGRKDMPSRKDLGRKDSRFDAYDDRFDDDNDDARFDAEDVYQYGMQLAEAIVETREDALDILGVLAPSEDVQIRTDMSPDETRAAVVYGFYPNIEKEHFDSADYVKSRFDGLHEKAMSLYEMMEQQENPGGGQPQRRDSINDFDDPYRTNAYQGTHRQDADQLENLVGASSGGFNTGRGFDLRRGPASPDKMNPNSRRMKNWTQPGTASKSGLIGIGGSK